MGAPNSQQAAGPPHPQPVPSVDLGMGSDCDPQLPTILTTAEQPMDLQIETATNEVKNQTSRMEDIQTVPKATVKQSGYVPPFFIVTLPVSVFGAIVIAPIQKRFRTRSSLISCQRSANGRYLLRVRKTTTTLPSPAPAPRLQYLFPLPSTLSPLLPPSPTRLS